MTLLLLFLLTPGLFWDGAPATADVLKQAGITKIAVPAAMESEWKGQSGISVEAVDLSSRTLLKPPAVQMRMNEASASRSPWIDGNGWQFIREPRGGYYYNVEGPSAALAAAEAFVFGGDAPVQPDTLVQTDAGGLPALGEMLAFLGRIEPSDLLPRVNIGYVDDGSVESGELLNLLVRKNLLFKLVTTPDPSLDLNVRFGSDEFLKGDTSDPSRLAQSVRARLTDDKRLFRVYGSDTVVARLMGDEKRARLYLLNYSSGRRSGFGIRVRVLGCYQNHKGAVSGLDNPDIREYVVTENATEFTIPEMGILAVIDLSGGR